VSGAWPWLALAGLGAFHGINPAMGWLFAVALGLHRGGRAVVLEALVPIALGHALHAAVMGLARLCAFFGLDGAICAGCSLAAVKAFSRTAGRFGNFATKSSWPPMAST
jgi:hypothetical protein